MKEVLQKTSQEAVGNLPEFKLPIKTIKTPLFVIIQCIPFVNIIYNIVWFRRIYRALQIKGFLWLVIVYLMLFGFAVSIESDVFKELFSKYYIDGERVSFFAYVLFYLSIAVMLSKRIQKYAYEHCNLKITCNALGVYFFTIIYVNFMINSFADRCRKAYIAENQREVNK